MDSSFFIVSPVTEKPNNEHFKLHVHDNYEIFMFLEGDSKYVVEENVYNLKPYDVVIIRKNQLHRIYHNSPSKYSRIVLNVFPEFFEINACREYEKQFVDCSFDSKGNKIDGEIVRESGLFDAFMRTKKYSENFEKQDSPIVKAGIIEILYILNIIKLYSKPNVENAQLKEVIEFINHNFTENITLDSLEKNFFISKYHLCRIFSRATGLTVHQYIIKKRLACANELIKQGQNLGMAAENSGFNNYSSFYRAYLSEFGVKPQEEKKHINAI